MVHVVIDRVASWAVAACLVLGPACSLADADDDLERAINELQAVSEAGIGYSPAMTGSDFLPFAGTDQFHAGLLGVEAPKKSAALEVLVRGGAAAVPLLIRHLDDNRPTRLKRLDGMMWCSFPDEYDFNRRLTKAAPSGVNLEEVNFARDEPDGHTITVGDLCFVALGQIVNREFSAARYQPTGGLIVNSPSRSKTLCRVAREEFAGWTPEKHRAMLVADFRKPDHGGRLIGAYNRLAFYYPDAIVELVLKQLEVPVFDDMAVHSFAHDQLYPAKSSTERRILFERFVREHGEPVRDGLRLQLCADLDQQIADEEHRLTPPLNPKFDARAPLMELFGCTGEELKKPIAPYVDTWARTSRAEFVKSLVHDKSPKIDHAVLVLFRGAFYDEPLALACIRRLLDRGYDDEINSFVQRKLFDVESNREQLLQIRKYLDAKKKPEQPL